MDGEPHGIGSIDLCPGNRQENDRATGAAGGSAGPSTVACSSDPHGRAAGSGPAQRPDAGRPLVTSGPLHGTGMGNPPQSTAGQGQRLDACPTEADVESIRPPGGGHCLAGGGRCEEERLESLGHPPGESDTGRRRSLHSQEQSQLVNSAAPHGAVSTDNVLRLLDHQHYRCALAGRCLTPQTASLDHIMPMRRGGVHAIENTQVLHKDVNRAKGSLSNEEFLAMCREVVQWTDSASGNRRGNHAS